MKRADAACQSLVSPFLRCSKALRRHRDNVRAVKLGVVFRHDKEG